MKKYILVAKNTWDEIVTYRLNFVMWRVRNVIRLIVFYFLWLAVFASTTQTTIFGYNQAQLLTYVLGSLVIAALVFSSRTQEIAGQINEGVLSNYLIRPINYFGYVLSRDMSDKAFNFLFSFFEILLIIFILQPSFFAQTNLSILILTFISVFIANFLFFFTSLLLSFLAFWSPEVWAPRFILFVILDFFSGGLFPLDMLPKNIFHSLQFLPFQFFIFFPLKIYLGQLTSQEIIKGFLISGFWLLILYILVKYVWSVGLRSYTAAGR